jgi:hypothetical protein
MLPQGIKKYPNETKMQRFVGIIRQSTVKTVKWNIVANGLFC